MGGEAWAGAAPSVGGGGAGLWRPRPPHFGASEGRAGQRCGARATSIIFASEPFSPAVWWETEARRGRLHLD